MPPPPAQDRWEADVVTADGGTVHVRPIRGDDGPRLVAFHSRQSAESIYFRFFSPRPELSDAEVEHFTHVDGRDRMAFIALVGDDLIAVARYDRLEGRTDAEVAFFVDEEYKGRGVATILLEYLAAAAREVGITSFSATVLPTNRRMIGVFRQAGFKATSQFAGGVIEVHLDLEPTPEALAAMEERARSAEARSVARLLRPSSIAVIGAGREPGGLGHELFRHLLEHRFAGPVYPINPYAEHVAGVRAFASILDVPDRVDLAVIALPTAAVAEAVEQCALARVGGLVVLSGGFSEASAEGGAAERELVSFARRNGMRMIGPNSMGVINTDPDVSMHASFAPIETIPGRVSLSAQSGALVAAILDGAHRIGLGIATAVSIGNKADISGNDLLRYWASDERTTAVLLYLESFGNPRRFSRLARDVSRTKPIVAATHAPSPMTDALLAQTGVVRVDTIEEMLDVARVLAHQPVVPGPRVAILGNAGGPTTLAADASLASGLELAMLAPDTVALVRELAPAGDPTANPVELTYLATAGDYERALGALLADAGVDAVLVVYTPPTRADVDAVGAALLRGSAAAPDKVLVASLFAPQARLLVSDGERSLPNFRFADSAARALGRAAEYGRWRQRPAGTVPDLEGTDVDAAEAIVKAALAANPNGAPLSREAARQLAAAAGLEVVDERIVHSAADVVAAAAAIGYPVALRASRLDHFPKTEAGGLALDLHDEDATVRAYERMHAHLGPAMEPAIVQRMVEPGVDVRLRVIPDPVVGAAIAIGPGGAAGELLLDDAVQVVPLTDVSADDLLGSSHVAAPLGDRARAHLRDAALRLSWLADELPSIADAALNPIIVRDDGATVIGMTALVVPQRREPELPVRRL